MRWLRTWQRRPSPAAWLPSNWSQKGLLDSTRIDIVHTLLHPHAALPGYEILDVIGAGGMGVVYRARQKNLDRVVALKSVLVSQLQNAGAIARFQQEALAVGRLQHPHIVAAYDFGRQDGRLFLTLEFVEGENLDRLLERNGNLDEALAWGLARQVAAGLAHASQAGIVHRDIKPANLLLVEPLAGFPLPPGVPLVKIADFGLAYLTHTDDSQSRLTTENAALGTPHYLAPEQLGDGPVDQRADIYALGVTVYHMLAGRPPFTGKSLPQVLAAKLTSDPVPLSHAAPHASDATCELVAEMLARDPAVRIADYRVLLERIDQILVVLPRPTANPIAPAMPSMSSPRGVTLPARDEATMSMPAGLSPLVNRTEPLSHSPLPQPVRSGRRWFLRSLVALPLFVAGIAFLPRIRRVFSPSIPVRVFPVRGQHELLLDGRTLNDWLPTGGTWRISHDLSGTPVIAGKDGVLRRDLAAPSPRIGPPQHFRFAVRLALHEADAVELRFDLDDHFTGVEAIYSVVRINARGVELGRQSGTQPFLCLGGPYPLPTSGPSHTVAVERQPGFWWIYWEDQLVGTIPFHDGRTLQEFQVAVTGCPAWLYEVEIEELLRQTSD